MTSYMLKVQAIGNHFGFPVHGRFIKCFNYRNKMHFADSCGLISVVVLLAGSGIIFRQNCLYQHQTGIGSFRFPVKRTSNGISECGM